MICDSCKWAGHNNTLGNTSLAKDMHDNCKGDCGCQHKIGPNWFIKKGKK